MANFSSSSVGSGMGTFRGMMWCFISDWPSTLSILPIFYPRAVSPWLLETLQPLQPFFFSSDNNPPKKYSNSFINGSIQIIHFSKPRWKSCSVVISYYCPKMPFTLIQTFRFTVYSTVVALQNLLSKVTIKVQLLSNPESTLWFAWPIHYLKKDFLLRQITFKYRPTVT